jgi:hypothetical protein
MAFDWVGPDLVFGGMTTVFIITGILSLRDAAAGLCVCGGGGAWAQFIALKHVIESI